MNSDINEVNINSVRKAREIVQEIVSFGVNDFEIKQIIKMLSLELEDTEFMKKLNNLYTNDTIETKEKLFL